MNPEHRDVMLAGHDADADALRAALQRAFDRAGDLEASPDFPARLRDRLRAAVKPEEPRGSAPPRWLALAATIALAVGLAGGVVVWRSTLPDALALDAVADHWNCALKYRLIRRPVPLNEAARRFDKTYSLLLDAPPDSVPTSNGDIRVTERHACAFGDRRFAHVVMRYRGRVVSLLLTANSGATGPTAFHDPAAQVEGTSINGFSVLSVPATDHVILLVSDLTQQDLDLLAQVVSVPLARQIGRGLIPGVPDKLAFSARSADAPLLGFCLRPAL